MGFWKGVVWLTARNTEWGKRQLGEEDSLEQAARQQMEGLMPSRSDGPTRTTVRVWGGARRRFSIRTECSRLRLEVTTTAIMTVT